MVLWRPLCQYFGSTFKSHSVWVDLQDAPVGRWEFYSGKAERVHSAHRGRCIAHMFAMHVEEELASWPESPARKRIWVCRFASKRSEIHYTPSWTCFGFNFRFRHACASESSRTVSTQSPSRPCPACSELFGHALCRDRGGAYRSNGAWLYFAHFSSSTAAATVQPLTVTPACWSHMLRMPGPCAWIPAWDIALVGSWMDLLTNLLTASAARTH